MKSISLFLAVLFTQTKARPQRRSLLNRFPEATLGRRLGRVLQEDNNNNLCSFDAYIAGDCTYAEFCLPSEPNSAIYCQGLPTSTWTIEVVYLETCYDSLDDFVGYRADPSKPLPPDGYCSEESGLFTFSQEVLMSVTLNDTITAPYNSAIIETFNLVPCEEGQLPDFVFGANYCYDGCPTAASIDGTTCTGTCTICADGSGLLNCSNLDPSLVYSCSDDLLDDDIYEELFTFLGRDETPVTSPSASPIATPISTPTVSETQQPISSNAQPVQPVASITVAPTPVPSSGVFTTVRTMAAFASSIFLFLY